MEELINYMVCAKMEHKEYKELAEEIENPDLAELYEHLAEKEKEAYKLMKEYVLSKIKD